MGVIPRRDTSEAKAFWEHAEKTALKVETWPAWKRGEAEYSTPRHAATIREGSVRKGGINQGPTQGRPPLPYPNNMKIFSQSKLHNTIGRVCEVRPPRTIVINLGRNDGVEVGMVYAVVSNLREVKDPDTGEVLGQTGDEVIRIRVVDAQMKFSACESFGVPQGAKVVVPIGSSVQYREIRPVKSSIFPPRPSLWESIFGHKANE